MSIDEKRILDFLEWDISLFGRSKFDKNSYNSIIKAITRKCKIANRALSSYNNRYLVSETTSYNGVFKGSKSKKILENIHNKQIYSASKLETYGKCPYQYFLRYILDIEVILEPEYKDPFDALAKGSLYHNVLEKYWYPFSMTLI